MFRVRFLKNNVEYCNIQYIYIKTVELCTNLRCGPDGKIKFFSTQQCLGVKTEHEVQLAVNKPDI